ncbi:MAG: GNAT family N-acetyltransferase [Pirellulales bacterium]
MTDDDDDDIDELDYSISFRIGRSLADGGGEDHAVQIHGEIIYDTGESGNAPPEVVGTLDGYLCQVSNAIDSGADVFWEVFDQSQTLNNLHSAVFDGDTGEVKEEIKDQWNGEPVGDDVLYIELIHVLPAHRGHNLGLRALYRAIELFGPANGLVVIEPGPLQHGGRAADYTQLELCRFEQDKKKALTRLRRYWKKFGFRQIPNSNYFAFPMAFSLPKFKKIMPKE